MTFQFVDLGPLHPMVLLAGATALAVSFLSNAMIYGFLYRRHIILSTFLFGTSFVAALIASFCALNYFYKTLFEEVASVGAPGLGSLTAFWIPYFGGLVLSRFLFVKRKKGKPASPVSP